MRQKAALIFGDNEYALEIAKNVSYKYENIYIYTQEDRVTNQSNKSLSIEKFDLSDDWDHIKDRFDIAESVAFCALEDDASNIFLCISLHASFKDLRIIALSKNKESANKLLMAGATKVIPLIQTTADIIVEMLEKPIVTEVFHNILYGKSKLKIAQIELEEDTIFKGQTPFEIDWSDLYGIVVISIIHKDLSSEFIYSAKARHHILSKGDVLVVVGYDEDIKSFEKKTRSLKR